MDFSLEELVRLLFKGYGNSVPTAFVAQLLLTSLNCGKQEFEKELNAMVAFEEMKRNTERTAQFYRNKGSKTNAP